MDGATIAQIGFGEAGAALAVAGARGFDRLTDRAESRAAKQGDFARGGVVACDDAAGAIVGAVAVLSLVTADQSLPAAETGAASIGRGALWLDMNSVAPATKAAAARVIDAAGGRYVDVAVMAPVYPVGKSVPLLLAGAAADDAAVLLMLLGFGDVRVVAGPVGAASSIKMIRSVMVKGIEALTAECFLAAAAAGVTDAVAASLAASWPGTDWVARADYNLDRMMLHGVRRAAEMDEVTRTLDGLGTGSTMSRATAARQHAIGSLGLAPVATLAAKVAAITAIPAAVAGAGTAFPPERHAA